MSESATTEQAMMSPPTYVSWSRRIAAIVALAGAGSCLAPDDPRSGQPDASAGSSSVPAEDLDRSAPATIRNTTPATEAVDVSGSEPLVVEFTRPMAVTSLTSESVTLVGPTG